MAIGVNIAVSVVANGKRLVTNDESQRLVGEAIAKGHRPASQFRNGAWETFWSAGMVDFVITHRNGVKYLAVNNKIV